MSPIPPPHWPLFQHRVLLLYYFQVHVYWVHLTYIALIVPIISILLGKQVCGKCSYSAWIFCNPSVTYASRNFRRCLLKKGKWKLPRDLFSIFPVLSCSYVILFCSLVAVVGRFVGWLVGVQSEFTRKVTFTCSYRRTCSYLCNTYSSFVAVFFLPDTPTWLVGQGRVEFATEVIIWLR